MGAEGLEVHGGPRAASFGILRASDHIMGRQPARLAPGQEALRADVNGTQCPVQTKVSLMKLNLGTLLPNISELTWAIYSNRIDQSFSAADPSTETVSSVALSRPRPLQEAQEISLERIITTGWNMKKNLNPRTKQG